MMKKQLGIIGIIFLSFGSCFAGNSDTTRVTDVIDRSLQRDDYHLIFDKAPSLLSVWEKGDYALISTGFTSSKGDYTHPRLFLSKNLFEIRSESVKSLPVNGWRFFGSVAYTNGNAETGKWNMSYYLPTNGSPYYYMIQQEGTWKNQSYDFNVAAQKNISGRLSAGVGLKYLGDLHFRTFDSRNENTTLKIQVLPSLSMNLDDKNYISIGLLYQRLKNEPDISNKYQHGTEPEKYHLFFNQGLGTWDNSPSQMRMIDSRYGGFVSYRKLSDNRSFDAIYTMDYGSEEWLLKSVSTLNNRKEEISRYSYFSHDLALRHRSVTSAGSFVTNFDIKNIFGDGAVYKESADAYQDNYQFFSVTADLDISYIRSNSVLRRLSAKVKLDNSSKNDYNYGHILEYTNIEGTLSADVTSGKRRAMNLIFGGLFSYKMNLSGNHNPMAASSNFFNTEIAIPSYAYLTSDFYRVGARLSSEFDIAGGYRLDITLSGDLLKPVSINNYVNQSTFTLNDNYYIMSLSLCFNF